MPRAWSVWAMCFRPPTNDIQGVETFCYDGTPRHLSLNYQCLIITCLVT